MEMTNELRRRKMWRTAAVFAVVIVALCLCAPDAAWAAPGGMVKAAARSTIGKIFFTLLVIVLLPILIYFGVRSARATKRTKADLARLAQTMPQYCWLDINDRATAVFSWVWSAWSQQKMDLTKHHTTSWYWQNQQLQLDEWARNGLTNVCRLIKIETVTPLFVQHNAENGGEGSRVVLDIKARVVDYLEDAQGNVVQGDKTEGDLDTVWTLVWNDGDWKLNKIEDGANELTYLFAPNEVPQAVGQKVAV